MGHEFIKISTMVDALRNTGYKSIESAMSEIIDNSIQWYSKNIFVIMSEELNSKTGRNNINEIAFIDNGSGMDTEVLAKCLAYGETTHKSRKGMGRFGVGLPQSSMYACPLVEVYSWYDGYDNCQKVVLDINAVKKQEKTELDDPVSCKVPEKYKKYLKYKVEINEEIKEYNFLEHGTLVIWKKCDRVNPKTINSLFKRLDLELGRRFRYFIDQGQVEIKLIHHENPDFSRNIMPNDPLLLMKSNIVLGNPNSPGRISVRDNINCTETLFETYTNKDFPDGIIDFPVKYVKFGTSEIKEGIVKIKFSKVKDIFYDQTAFPAGDPGATQMGKYIKMLEGISIVRADREIDFGQFDFYENTNQPQHRWWGCEINFEPELDEAFGVANNKQHVELKREDEDAYVDDEAKPMWIQLRGIINTTIKSMYDKNLKLRKNSRTIKDSQPPSTNFVNEVEEEIASRSDEESSTDSIKKTTKQEDLLKKNEEDLKEQGLTDLTKDDITEYMNKSVKIFYGNISKYGPLFDYTFELGSCKITINMDHIYYQTYLANIFTDIDTKTAFEFLIAAFVKSVDLTNSTQDEQNDKLVTNWNERLRKYTEKRQHFGEDTKI